MANTIANAAATQLAAQNRPTIKDYITKMEKEIARALPSVMTPERFTRITLSALSASEKLQECSPQSFLGAMMTAAQLGLEPNTPLGHAYLIPYQNHGRMECQFQLGYKGLIDLCYRGGDVATVQAHTVYENDTFEYELGLEPKLRHIPARSGRGEPVCFYGLFKTKDGGFGFEVMSVEDVRQHAQRYSKAYGRGPWQTNFEEMAKKTVLKRALKYAPMKSEFARALSSDESVKSGLSEDMLELPNETYIEAEAGPGFAVDPDTGEVAEHA